MRKWIALTALALQTIPAQAAGLTVHEWGTFTSMQGSSGENVEGLHHEDESLPSFVHELTERRPGVRQACKGADCRQYNPPVVETPVRVKTGVTQKMETPVIYFYGTEEAARASVQVDFPQGIISQWYPAVSRLLPSPEGARSLTGGQAVWDVKLSKAPLAIPSVRPDDIWAPSRQVQADFVSAQGENERLIFYRGLGRFDTPLNVHSKSLGKEQHRLSITNASGERVPAAFLLHTDGKAGYIRSLGALAGQKTPHVFSVTLGDTAYENVPMEAFVAQASKDLQAALVASGLYADEARAMVNTWSKSYFRTPGSRILYVLPREWTDAILPIKVTPEPSQLVRTLIGRVEILTQSEESGILDDLEEAAKNGTSFDLQALGRFAEPKLRRVVSLTQNPRVHELIQSLVDSLN